MNKTKLIASTVLMSFMSFEVVADNLRDGGAGAGVPGGGSPPIMKSYTPFTKGYSAKSPGRFDLPHNSKTIERPKEYFSINELEKRFSHPRSGHSVLKDRHEPSPTTHGSFNSFGLGSGAAHSNRYTYCTPSYCIESRAK